MGAVLLTAGAHGKRFALPHSRILLHQPMGGFQGQATDIDIHAREIIRMRQELEEILVRHTGQPMEKIHQDTDRDYFLSGEQAREYGIIDKVIEKREYTHHLRLEGRLWPRRKRWEAKAAICSVHSAARARKK